MTKAQYDEEDTRPTSKKELWGFYCYGLSAEVFVVCGVGENLSFPLPQLLQV